jgi:hypothetical protein
MPVDDVDFAVGGITPYGNYTGQIRVELRLLFE